MVRAAPPPLHFCVTGESVIVLDLAQDRYFALPLPLGAAVSAIAGHGAMGRTERDTLKALVRGAASPEVFLARSHLAEPGNAAFPTCPDPESDLMAGLSKVPVGRGGIALAALAGLTAKGLVRLCPLRVLLTKFGTVRALPAAAGNSPDIESIAAAFERSSLVFASDGNCLPRTMAFVWLARKRGHDARLVLGVRNNPFSAHAWAQSGSVVLNDHLDHVRVYRPILVL